MALQSSGNNFIQSLNDSQNSSALSPAVKRLLCETGVQGQPPRTAPPSDGTLNHNSRERRHVQDSSSQLKDSSSQLMPGLLHSTVCCHCPHFISADGYISFDRCADLLPTKREYNIIQYLLFVSSLLKHLQVLEL